MGKVGRFLSNLQIKVENWLSYLSAGVIASMMIITIADVVARRGFSQHVKGSYEYVALLFVYLIFFGLAYAQRTDAHITIGVLYMRLPRVARLRTQAVICIIGFGIFGTLTYFGAESALFAQKIGDTLLGAIQVITWPSRVGVPIGFGVLALRFLAQLIGIIRRGELLEETAAGERTGVVEEL
jgi:TRAP-type C4-dicarboxylate transport system permease small subunit